MTATPTLVAAEPPVARVRAPVSWPRVALPVALVTIAAVTIGAAGRQLWADEYATWYATTLSWAQFWHMLTDFDIVHALYYVVMRVWTDAFGYSALALRAPSMIGVAVAAGGLTLLGRRLYDSRVGITAGLLFAGIPEVSRYGQEARSYAWLTALAVLSTLALLRALDRPSRSRFLLYGASLLVLTCLHFVAALVLVAHAALVWPVIRRAGGVRVRRAWLATVAVLVLAAAPLLREASTQSWQVGWIRNDRRAVAHFPIELFGSRTVVWVIVSLAALGVVVLWYRRRALIAPLLAWAVLPPLVCYVTFPVAHLFLARYVLFTLPGWCLLAAVAIAVPVGELRRWMLPADTAVVLALAVLAVAAAGLTGQEEVRRSPVAGEADFRAAADLIDERYEPGDGIAYGTWPRDPGLPLAYELHAKPPGVFVNASSGQFDEYATNECRDAASCLAGIRRVWLVVVDTELDPLGTFPRAQAELLRRDFTTASTDRFTRVRVVLMVHR